MGSMTQSDDPTDGDRRRDAPEQTSEQASGGSGGQAGEAPGFPRLADMTDTGDGALAERIRSRPAYRDDLRFLRTMARTPEGQHTLNQCLRQAVARFFTTYDIAEDPPEELSAQIETSLVTLTNDIIQRRNTAAVKDAVVQYCGQKGVRPENLDGKMRSRIERETAKLNPLTGLAAQQVAEILIRLHAVARIPAPTDPEGLNSPMLGVYQYRGRMKGLYAVNDDVIAGLITRYVYDHDQRYTSTVLSDLRYNAPLRMPDTDPRYVAVNNGVFDLQEQALLPFSPDRVLLSKSYVDYDPDAASPRITQPDGSVWDLDSWIAQLSDSPGVPELLWQVMAAVNRPQVPWDKGVWLVNPAGANGKGTYLQLLKNLCGPQGLAWTTIPLEDFGRQFGLETLIGKSAILNDESRSNAFIDDVATLKAIITHDTVNITRKNKVSVAYQAKVLLVQCTNDPPRVRDKTGSWLRRLLLIPFDKNFRRLGDNPAIKADYINRPEVLRYALRRTLAMRFDRFDEPPATRRLLGTYESDNDPVLRFWQTYRGEFAWDLLPWEFLYVMYRAWSEREGTDDRALSKRNFIRRVSAIVEDEQLAGDEGAAWAVLPSNKARRPSKYMGKGEPLLYQYRESRFMQDLPWAMANGYRGQDVNKSMGVDLNALPKRVSGLIRLSTLREEEGGEARPGQGAGSAGEGGAR